LFTATSAVCVTGLVTISTGDDLSFFGQAIVLFLIQIGGLGIMTLSAMIVLAAGKQLAGGAEHALGQSLGGGTSPARVFQTIRAIAVGTILIEALGAVTLFGLTQDQFATSADAAWFAFFHAVSAFCNAGFALQNNSLSMFADQPLVLHTISLLVILGGLGFGVMLAVVQTAFYVIKAQFFRSEGASLFSRPKPKTRLNINVKLVSLVSAALLGFGFIAFAALEWHYSLSDLDFGAKLHHAWFQSVTFRTAGFTTVDLNHMSEAMIVLSLFLMFVGASPGSTGGGIKTSTIAVLFLSMTTVFSKKRDTEVFGRRIEPEVVSRAVAVTTISLLTVFVGTFLLILTQNAPFEVLLFEATSAIATAGLSIGGTAALDDSGKFIVMVLMLVGRIGPITTAALWQTDKQERHRYPKAEVIVG
jgi:trk system potassium uptake protein TrkH